jgi:HSP20 family protein
MPDGRRRPHTPRPSGPLTLHNADELEDYVRGGAVGFVSTPKWRPPADLYETDDGFVLVMDIAGVEPDEFSVALDAGMLTVSGERKERASGRREYHAMEVKVGPFERSFRLPTPVDPASLRATYDLGFLEIRLAKLPPHAVGVVRK